MCSDSGVGSVAELTGLDADELLDEITHVIGELDRLGGRLVHLIGAAQRSGAAEDRYGLTVRSWLQRAHRRSRAEAGTGLLIARHLPERPVLAAALAAGEITVDHARAIVTALTGLDDADASAGEEILCQAARALPPADIVRLGEEIRLRVGADEDRDAQWARRHAQRRLSLAVTLDGMVSISGLLDPLTGERLLAAISALTDTPGSPDDHRSPGERRADALGELAAHTLACAGLPTLGGERPHVLITIPLADLRSGGPAAAGQLHHTGLPISVAAARQIACDAGILPAVLGSDGQILDIGRTSPTWTTAIRRAARLRDADGCQFPGCTTGHTRTELHHLRFWSDGGPTALDNAVTLCPFHHHLLHHSSWALTRHADGHLTATSPHGGHQFHKHPPASPPPGRQPPDSWPTSQDWLPLA